MLKPEDFPRGIAYNYCQNIYTLGLYLEAKGKISGEQERLDYYKQYKVNIFEHVDRLNIEEENKIINNLKIGVVDMGCSCCKEKGEVVLEVFEDGGEPFCSCCKNADRISLVDAKIKGMDSRYGAMAQIIDGLAKSINKVRETVDLKIKKLDEKAVIPQYAHEGDAGFDLSAIVSEKNWDGVTDTVTVVPGEKYIAKTGLAFAIPKGYELQVRPRSGLAYKHGITVINSPGTVDSGYRGEVMVILLNTGTAPFDIKSGDRIAQAVINKLPTVKIREVDDLDETERGADGFGSTG